MLWQSSLSADGNSPLVGQVTLLVSRIAVWIIFIVLQLQVIHFLEQRLIYLHVVSSCKRQKISPSVLYSEIKDTTHWQDQTDFLNMHL